MFDTEKFLKRPVLVAVSNTSGLAGIAHWMNTIFRLKGDEALDKSHPLVVSLKEWVDEQYDGGRITVITDKELSEQIQLRQGQFGMNLPPIID